MAIAYLLKKLPGTFAVACRVFTELKYRLPEFQPKSFLDFGAGLGKSFIFIESNVREWKHCISRSFWKWSYHSL